MTDYKYLGDRFTDPAYKGQECQAVRRPDGRTYDEFPKVKTPTDATK